MVLYNKLKIRTIEKCEITDAIHSFVSNILQYVGLNDDNMCIFKKNGIH